MGLMQRRKGRAFEQAIARRLRATFPTATVRRALQAQRAFNSDVFLEGVPDPLSRLWLELQDAREPTPLVKLLQAERDVARVGLPRLNDPLGSRPWIPVVVWHRTAERTIWATLRSQALHDLLAVTEQRLRGRNNPSCLCLPTGLGLVPVTLDFGDLLGILLGTLEEKP
jgi:hypothetical protein